MATAKEAKTKWAIGVPPETKEESKGKGKPKAESKPE